MSEIVCDRIIYIFLLSFFIKCQIFSSQSKVLLTAADIIGWVNNDNKNDITASSNGNHIKKIGLINYKPVNVILRAQDELDVALDLHAFVDASTFMVSSLTSLSQLHLLFHSLGLRQIYCGSQGKLEGIITKNDLLRSIHALKLLSNKRQYKDLIGSKEARLKIIINRNRRWQRKAKERGDCD